MLDAVTAANLNEIILGVRPESFTLSTPDDAGDTAHGLKIEVMLVEELGADAYVHGKLLGDDPDASPYVVRFDGRVPPRIGDTLSIDVRTGEEHAFHPETEERLG